MIIRMHYAWSNHNLGKETTKTTSSNWWRLTVEGAVISITCNFNTQLVEV